MSLTVYNDNTQAMYVYTPLVLQGWVAYLHAYESNFLQGLSYLLELVFGFRV